MNALRTVFILAVTLLITCSTLAQSTAPAETTEAAKQIVVMRLDGQYRETPPEIDLGLPDIRPNLFWDQLRLVRMAAEDRNVAALVVLVDQPYLTLAQSQELLMELKGFAAAGKPVFAHSDTSMGPSYMVTLPARRIAMTPGATLMLFGVNAQMLYFRGLMDKLGIEAEAIHMGQYKLAAEPFTNYEPSDEMIEQLTALVDGIYGQSVAAIAEGRGLTAEQVRALIDDGPYLAENAVEAGLIDAVAHRSDFLESVREETGGYLVYDYGRAKPPQIRPGLAGLIQLLTSFGAGGAVEAENKVAIVLVDGMIVEGESEEYFGADGTAGSETLRKAFRDIARDRTYKAVVVRIDSPGGSSTASEIIWQQIRDAAEDLPVAVSMGSEAASGGYYIAVAGQRIFADSGTITGSIGVITGKPIFTEMLNKLGVNTFSVSRGKNADLFDPFSRFSEHGRETLLRQIERIYDLFVQRVREGRGERVEDVERLATGRVYTGAEAVELGLVDEIGTLADAVDWAASEAELETYQAVLLPKPKSLPEIILESIGYDVDPEARMMGLAAAQLAPQGGVFGSLAAYNLLAGGRMDALARVSVAIRLLGRGDALALCPCRIRCE